MDGHEHGLYAMVSERANRDLPKSMPSGCHTFGAVEHQLPVAESPDATPPRQIRTASRAFRGQSA